MKRRLTYALAGLALLLSVAAGAVGSRASALADGPTNGDSNLAMAPGNCDPGDDCWPH